VLQLKLSLKSIDILDHFLAKKTEVRTPNIPKNFLIELGPHKRISKHRLNGPGLKNQKKNETYLLHFLYKIIVKIYFSWFFNRIFSTAKSLSTLLSKLSKRNFCRGSDAKTIFLGYFNKKTLALWKITSNKSIEKTKNFKAIFLWTISKNEWCNASEKLLSKRANFKIQWKLSAAYQIRFGFTEHEKNAIR
jgi:hypothetical protein